MDADIAQKLAEFFTQYKKIQYKKGEIVIRAEDDPAGIFYLEEGTVKMYLISRNGDEIVLNLFKPISFFPMSWAINDTKNPYYFEAVNTLTMYRAPRHEVVDFLQKNSDVLFDLLARVYRGLDGVLSKMAYLMGGKAYARLITELLITAKRFGTTGTEGIQFTITEKELSAATGITRETVSREIKILREKGLINFQKNILIIPHIEDLENELANNF